MAFAQAMLNPDLPNAEKAKALRCAVEAHKTYAQNASATIMFFVALLVMRFMA